jgi:outer membrane protein assembly factor BamD
LNLKYDAAVKYYEKKKYYNALQLFEELVPLYRGTAKAESTYYYYSMCYLMTNDYASGAYNFETFVKTFPNSEHAEEAAFNVAYCYYLDSPGSSLDQTSTVDAIKQFQIFVNKYPESKKISECNKLIDELQLKLETKEMENARLYYKMEEYKAAVVALANVVKDFPATQFKEECLFLSVKSYFLYASNSIETKKIERYNSTIESYNKLTEAFPSTHYKKEADKIVQDAKEKLEDLKLLASPESRNKKIN